MAIKYAPSGVELTPYTLTPTDHAAIGRLAVACAQLELILTHWLAQMAAIQPVVLDIILGVTSIRTKLNVAANLAELNGTKMHNLHKNSFSTQQWAKIFQCRNTICHGIPLGKANNEEIAYKTTMLSERSEGKATFNVIGYSTANVAKLAALAESEAIRIEGDLKLQPSLQKYRKLNLSRHPKGRPQGQTKRGDVPPPRP